jgi:hypothetical protein
MAKKDRAKEASFVPIREPNRVVTVAPNFTSLYANDIQVQTWDMRLIFGEVGDVIQSDVPALTIKRIGELRISLPLAKKLAMIMIDQVKSYEAQVGEVPLPKI